jgi:hypothetical protein
MSERQVSGKALPITTTLLACTFAGLGVLFVFAPAPAAMLYGSTLDRPQGCSTFAPSDFAISHSHRTCSG